MSRDQGAVEGLAFKTLVHPARVPFRSTGLQLPKCRFSKRDPLSPVSRGLVCETKKASPLKQAFLTRLPLVRTTPVTLKSALAKAMGQNQPRSLPDCTCTAAYRPRRDRLDTVSLSESHSVVIFVSIQCQGSVVRGQYAIPKPRGPGVLRPNDPVPVPGSHARASAIAGITDFCTHLNARPLLMYCSPHPCSWKGETYCSSFNTCSQ